MSPIFTYTGRNVDWRDACREVKEGRGDIFPLVVRTTKRGTSVQSLSFGYFYEDTKGDLWDVFFNQRGHLKTAATSDGVMADMLKIYPDDFLITIPHLTDANCVLVGKIDRSIHRLFRYEIDHVDAPVKT